MTRPLPKCYALEVNHELSPGIMAISIMDTLSPQEVAVMSTIPAPDFKPRLPSYRLSRDGRMGRRIENEAKIPFTHAVIQWGDSESPIVFGFMHEDVIQAQRETLLYHDAARTTDDSLYERGLHMTVKHLTMCLRQMDAGVEVVYC